MNEFFLNVNIQMDNIVSYLYKEFNGFKPLNYKQHKIHFVFTTWVCYQRQFTTKKQTRTILNNAKKLKLQKISFVLVYSRLNMLPKTEKKFKQVFTNYIYILCLEDVLPMHQYIHMYKPDLLLMYYLRIAVIKYYKNFLAVLEQTTFQANSGNSIMYVDSDIEFISDEFPCLYTEKGVCSYPKLNPVFAQSDKNNTLKNLEKTFKYVTEGQAYINAKINYLKKNRKYKPVIATGESYMICVRYDSVELFKEIVDDEDMIIDFHVNPEISYKINNTDPLYRENHTFMYLQLIKHLKHRNDLSWIIKRF